MATIDVRIDLGNKRKVVYATEDMPLGTLALPPCVPKTSNVYTTSTHPLRVPIVVSEKSAVADERPDTKVTKGPVEPRQKTYYVHPEYKLPEDPECRRPEEGGDTELEDEAEPKEGVASDVCVWEWKGDETLHPFWAVERLSEDELRRNKRLCLQSHT